MSTPNFEPMTDYRTLPADVKRELVFDALKFTKAVVALSNLNGESPEVWGERCSNAAYADVNQMSTDDINEAIEAIEQARRDGYGARMHEVALEEMNTMFPPQDQL